MRCFVFSFFGSCLGHKCKTKVGVSTEKKLRTKSAAELIMPKLSQPMPLGFGYARPAGTMNVFFEQHDFNELKVAFGIRNVEKN